MPPAVEHFQVNDVPGGEEETPARFGSLAIDTLETACLSGAQVSPERQDQALPRFASPDFR